MGASRIERGDGEILQSKTLGSKKGSKLLREGDKIPPPLTTKSQGDEQGGERKRKKGKYEFDRASKASQNGQETFQDPP